MSPDLEALTTNSVSAVVEESGRWLPPRVCEDIADRVLSDLAAHGYKITRNEENNR